MDWYPRNIQYNALQRLRDLYSDPNKVQPEETRAWKLLGFNIVDYTERMTNYVNNIKCQEDSIQKPPVDSCKLVLAALERIKKGGSPTMLREAYIDACRQCHNHTFCDSSALDQSAPNNTAKPTMLIDCDSIITLAMKYAQPFLKSIYSDYGETFKMPSAASGDPMISRDRQLLFFRITVSKDLGSGRANAKVVNYNVSQPALNENDKIFEVLSDFIENMTSILSPILDTNFQHINLTGLADGVPYNRPFQLNKKLMANLDEEWVYEVNENGSVIDSVKFKYLTRYNASSDEKNYALAFERAYQFKEKLPNVDMTFQIPMHKNIHAKISHVESGNERGVDIEINYKLRKCGETNH